MPLGQICDGGVQCVCVCVWWGGGGRILQSNISYAINPICNDIRPSCTLKRKKKRKMLLFTERK